MKKASLHATINAKVKKEFQENCKELGHDMSLVIEVFMERFNSQQAKYKSIIKNYEERKKKGFGKEGI